MNIGKQPPKWAARFLRWFVSEELQEEIVGDLEEGYYHRRNQYGKLKADLWFIRDVIKFFKPYSFEKYSKTKQYLPMFNNYVRIALRNLIKRLSFTTMNLLGLTAGIASVFLIALYIQHELTYDEAFPESDQVYRLMNKYRDQTYTCMSFPQWYGSTPEEQHYLTEKLISYDQVEAACHFVPNKSDIGPNGKYYVRVNGKELIEDEILYTNNGKAFQDIFPQDFIAGSSNQSFDTFSKVVLTKSKAIQIYGKDWRLANVVGDIINIQDESFEIGGVIEDVKGNVHFDFEMIIHQELIPSWGAYTYIKLTEHSSIDHVLKQLNGDMDSIFPGYSEDELQRGVSSVPLTSIHFTDGMLYELKPTANLSYIFTFSIVGLIILLIVWTNYANLSIAIYSGRQKEMGVRKVMGARSNDIAIQILLEAIMLTLICIPFAWIVVYTAITPFNELMDIGIEKEVLWSPSSFFVIAAVLLFTGLISGIYPAIVFSKKSLVKLFKGKLTTSRSRLWNARNGILATQFFMLIVLISMVMTIQQQMTFVHTKELGFEKEDILFFNVEGREKYGLIKAELERLPGVNAVGTGLIPGTSMYNQLTYEMRGGSERYADGTHIQTTVSSLDILGISSEAFDQLNDRDSVFIINETAANKLADGLGILSNELIGQTLVLEPEWQNEQFGYGSHYTIADIIPDFDYFSLQYETQPMLMEVRAEASWVYSAMVKVETRDVVSVVSAIEDAYLKVEKQVPFDVTFLDDHLDQLYTREKNAGILISGLTGVSMILAVMGLIGIIGFITITRQKEIGVRKVFGASVLEILYSLSKEYAIMMLLSTFIAIPAVMYLADQWLSNFAYRISPNFMLVLFSGFITLLLLLFVVIVQSYKSANMNPSDTLRNE
ncbi:FtsX-like permease family protein [Ekhidna sp.]